MRATITHTSLRTSWLQIQWHKLRRRLLWQKGSTERQRIHLATRNLAPATVTLLGLVLLGFTTQGEEYVPSSVKPPQPMREIRAAWVATVANIDWPSTNALSSAQQKSELIAILNRAADLKLNTVIFQVRPSCDALYASSIEPWSEYLTGTMGKAPEPFYDPLKFAVEEAHKRGLELHAWFNPYRARMATAKSPLSATHVSKTHPGYVRRYGKTLWLDPGEKAVQDYSLSVVMDVVARYDIDGVHFDDYFYPYKEKDAEGRELDFPDESSWRRFGAATGLSRDDWRRQNVNTFVRRTYESIKATKPWVKFGISPFGIWRPGNPPQVQGQDAYARLYADSRLWLTRGWVDYMAPQLYWSIGQPGQSFPVLLQWWAEQNAKARRLAPGMDCTKVGQHWTPAEILNQIRETRQIPGVSGHIHWDMKALMRNPSLARALQEDMYSGPALSPSYPWLHERPPAKPTLLATRLPPRVNWRPSPGDEVWLWVVQTRSRQQWRTTVLTRSERTFPLPKVRPEIVAITAVDRYGNASIPAVLESQRFSN